MMRSLGKTVMRELAAQLQQERRGGDPRGKPGRAEPAQARGRGQEGSRTDSRASRSSAPSTTPETPRDAAEEVVRAQKANPKIQGWAMVGGWAALDAEADEGSGSTEGQGRRRRCDCPRSSSTSRAGWPRCCSPSRLTTGATSRFNASSRRCTSSRTSRRSFHRWMSSGSRRTTSAPWARQLKTWGFTVPDSYSKLK